jgi:hypothetical protein
MNFPDVLKADSAHVNLLLKINQQIATNAELVAIDSANCTVIEDAITDAVAQITTAEAEVFDWLGIDPTDYPSSVPGSFEMSPLKIQWMPYVVELNKIRRFYKELTPDVPIKTITAQGMGSTSVAETDIYVPNDTFTQALYDLDAAIANINSSLVLLFQNVVDA